MYARAHWLNIRALKHDAVCHLYIQSTIKICQNIRYTMGARLYNVCFTLYKYSDNAKQTSAIHTSMANMPLYVCIAYDMASISSIIYACLTLIIIRCIHRILKWDWLVELTILTDIIWENWITERWKEQDQEEERKKEENHKIQSLSIKMSGVHNA